MSGLHQQSGCSPGQRLRPDLMAGQAAGSRTRDRRLTLKGGAICGTDLHACSSQARGAPTGFAESKAET